MDDIFVRAAERAQAPRAQAPRADPRADPRKLPNRVRVGYVRRLCDGATVRAINMDGDGNCMFRALAHQLDGGTSTSSEEAHGAVRAAIAAYAEARGAALAVEFAPFLGGVWWHDVVATVRESEVWDDEVMDIVVAPIAARVFGRVVRIVQRDVPAQEYAPQGDQTGAPIAVFRHEDHFWSVRTN